MQGEKIEILWLRPDGTTYTQDLFAVQAIKKLLRETKLGHRRLRTRKLSDHQRVIRTLFDGK